MSSLWSSLHDFTFPGADIECGLKTVRYDGKELASGQHKELIERSKAGEHIELEVDAVTYIQRETPNRNFLRFREGSLRKLAGTGKGSVFLRNHSQHDVLARGGTVTNSVLKKDEEGNRYFRQTLKLTKDWAVQGVLDGTIDRFSIGWNPSGPILYRHTGKEVERWPKHWPGEKLEDGTVVEWEFSDAELIETSGVNVPAVVGTQIEGIREALSLALGKSPDNQPSATNSGGREPHGETHMNGIKSILGLSDSASEQDIASAVRQLKADKELAEATAAESAEALAKANVELAAQQEVSIEREIEAALADGRLKTQHNEAGERTPSRVELAIRGLGEQFGLGALKEQLSALPKIHGASSTLQSVGTSPQVDPPQVATGDEASTILSTNPHLAGALAQLGHSEEDLREFGQLDGVPSPYKVRN